MLFDLQGKRRRVVQATYLTLAVLMGGGLVLFGIGGEVSGGLLDAFTSNNGGSGANVVEDRVDRNEERVQQRPRAVVIRQELVRDYTALANAQTPDDPNVTGFPEDAKDELQRASVHWNAYLELEKRQPDPALARVALQIYDPTGLNQPQQALKAARIVAEDGNNAQSYLLLVQYAVNAGDKRTEKLATQKSLDLATTPEERQAVRDQIKQLKAASSASQLPPGTTPGPGN